MKKIINEIEITATNYFNDFGFDPDQIKELIIKGQRDLIRVITDIEEIIDYEPTPINKLDHMLHTLKGLLSQLGNHKLAEKINKVRDHLDKKENKQKLKYLLL